MIPKINLDQALPRYDMKDNHLISKLAKQISDGSPSQINAALTAIRCQTSMFDRLFEALGHNSELRRATAGVLQQ